MSQFSWRTSSERPIEDTLSSAVSEACSHSGIRGIDFPDEMEHCTRFGGTDTLKRYQETLMSSDNPVVTTTDGLDPEPLISKLAERNKEIQELKAEVDYLTTQLESCAMGQTSEVSISARNITELKIELERTQGELTAVQAERDFQQAEVGRLKTLLLLREKELSIIQKPRRLKTPPKVDLDEKVKILLEQNKKLILQLVDGRNKLTKEEFVALLGDKVKDAVLLETEALAKKNLALEEQVEQLSGQISQKSAVLSVFERESVKTLESTDNEFRRQLGQLKTEISLLNAELEQKEEIIKQLRIEERYFDTETLILREIGGQKDQAVERKTEENRALRHEMAARNIECRGVLYDAEREISEKLSDMKKENIRIVEQFEGLQRSVEHGDADEKLKNIYGELGELRRLCDTE